MLLGSFGAASARGLATDIPDAQDLPGIARFASSVMIGYRTSAFEDTTIPTGAWESGAWKDSVRVAGRRTRLVYLAPRSASSLEVIRTYQQTLTEQGYQMLYQCSGFDACGDAVEQFYIDASNGKKLTDSHLLKYVFSETSVQRPQIYSAGRASINGDAHVFVFAAYQDNFADSEAGNRVAIFLEHVLSEPVRDRSMVLLSAQEMASALTQVGRVPLYGLQFDFNQASLRPESRPQLDALARMLSEQPQLNVYIVGHTDNTGTLESNLNLSQQRAETVVDSLIRNYGIIGERLRPQGVASLSPLATNATQEGRALNQRVEMVAQ